MTEKESLKAKEAYTIEELKAILRILRSEEGCPWDRKQTHASLIPCLREESREVEEAIAAQDMENLCEELGDLLFQVMIHSRIAEEEGYFSIEDVVSQIAAKMIRRHPHVFGDVAVNSEEEALKLWREIKSAEKREKS